MMTDAQMLQNLLAVYGALIANNGCDLGWFKLKEVIAELRRRVPESTRWDHSESEFSGTVPDREREA